MMVAGKPSLFAAGFSKLPQYKALRSKLRSLQMEHGRFRFQRRMTFDPASRSVGISGGRFLGTAPEGCVETGEAQGIVRRRQGL